jgi:hypothetical protein
MLFDAHARAFEAFAGVPQRGIYDLHVDGCRSGVGRQEAKDQRPL